MSVGFLVLFVCTGNICRSPLAERLFRSRVADYPVIETASAGVAGLTGRAMDAPSAQALHELGVDPRGHVARRLSPQLVSEAALILTAETSHRSVVVQSDPLVFRHAFTLREFGRLGAGLGPLSDAPTPPSREALAARVLEVAGQRGWADPIPEGADDIADPYGCPIEVARGCAGEIDEAVDRAVAVLGLSVRSGRGS